VLKWKENGRFGKGVEAMYQVGENVLYGIHGVCRVAGTEERVLDRKKVAYLVLEPLEQKGARFFVPSHNPAAMAKLRPVMTKEELDWLLCSQEVCQDGWIDDENQRKQYYRSLINSGDRTALLRMVRSLHQHRQSQVAAGRKFHLCDENFLRDAQKLLNSEFSLVLGIEPGQVADYVLNRLSEDENMSG